LTGRTRATVYRAAMLAPRSVISIATDSIWFTTPPVGLDIGPGMGQWGIEHENVDLLQLSCGVYSVYDPDTRGLIKSATRGFHSHIDWCETLQKSSDPDSVMIDVGLPSSLLWSLQNNEQINKIGKCKRVFRFDSDSKRAWYARPTREGLLTPGRGYDSYPLIEHGDNLF